MLHCLIVQLDSRINLDDVEAQRNPVGLTSANLRPIVDPNELTDFIGSKEMTVFHCVIIIRSKFNTKAYYTLIKELLSNTTVPRFKIIVRRHHLSWSGQNTRREFSSWRRTEYQPSSIQLMYAVCVVKLPFTIQQRFSLSLSVPVPTVFRLVHLAMFIAGRGTPPNKSTDHLAGLAAGRGDSVASRVPHARMCRTCRT